LLKNPPPRPEPAPPALGLCALGAPALGALEVLPERGFAAPDLLEPLVVLEPDGLALGGVTPGAAKPPEAPVAPVSVMRALSPAFSDEA